LRARAVEIARGDVEVERARVARAGRIARLSIALHLAFMLFLLVVALAWKFGFLRLRGTARARLAAPELGRGLVLFVWAEGFVSVLGRLRSDYPGGPFELIGALPSLAPAIAISVLLLGTRARPTDTPIKDLLRCPADPRSRRIFWVAALGSIGVVYAFSWFDGYVLSWLGFLVPWSDGIRQASLYGSWTQALLAQLSAVVIAPFAEELMYRGVLFGSLATRLSPHRAALISSIVFALVHGYSWHGFATVALSGYLWARLAARSGSLVPGMLAHGTLNLLIGIFRLAARA
jgi:membrane protease YdiL (CAAX protease family)